MSERRGMKALEMWCRRITTGYPGVSVDNMTTSWRDGLAFCALIHHFRPDLIDFSRLDKSDVYGNNELAFRIAERHLGIPALLDAADMAEYPVPDRLSIMTYLSQFYQAFASNGSSPVKRASETPENSLVISDVQSPPQKKPVLGIRKERCHVCNLPVFIAQRLRVNGLLYHRTCFKCNYCDSQLNPASCCEMDGEGFICESCPSDVKEVKKEEKVSCNVPDLVPSKVPDPDLTPDPEPPPLTPNHSLVGIRRMMFESYIKDTDDAKLELNVDVIPDVPDKELPKNPEHLQEENEKMEIAHDEIALCERDAPGLRESPSEKLPDLLPEKLAEKPPEKPPRSPKGIPPAMLTNHSDGPQDTHSVGQVVECSNVVLVNNLDRFSEDTKRSESGEELHADTTSLVEAKNVEVVVEAVNTALRDLSAGDPNFTEVLSSTKPEEKDPFVNKNDQEELIASVTSTDEVDNSPVKDESTPVQNAGVTDSSPKTNQSTEVVTTKSIQNTPAEETAASPLNFDNSLSPIPVPSPRKKEDSYPEGLNPFGDDEEEEVTDNVSKAPAKQSLNPFGSSSDEDEPVSSPRGMNPFGSDSEDDEPATPVPKPRSSGMSTPEPLPRNSRLRSSNRSLVSLTSVSSSRKKRPAPPPPPTSAGPVPPSPAPSRASISSTMSRSRKTKRAPPPPPAPTLPDTPVGRSQLESTRLEAGSSHLTNSTPVPDREEQLASQAQTFAEFLSANQSSLVITDIDISNMEEEIRQKVKAARRLDNPATESEPQALRGSESKDVSISYSSKNDESGLTNMSVNNTIDSIDSVESSDLRELDMEVTPVKSSITRGASVSSKTTKAPEPFVRSSVLNTSNRRLIPIPTKEERSLLLSEDSPSPIKEKRDKDTANLIQKAGDKDSLRKKKGWAPLPLAPKRTIKSMPAEQVRQELKDIEIKQQGLERQGIALEHKIRDKFNAEDSITPYVEELVLQLFELVNEKNELFRKQAELMYLCRQHSLEEEQADLEYQIRKLMSQPEANKTDSDKELEEKLINRLVKVVERRDAIVQCLEMDRLREAEEDMSIHTQLSQFSQAMGEEENREKLSEKLKNKKSRLSSISLLNLTSRDDDAERHKDKKKKWFTLRHTKNKR